MVTYTLAAEADSDLVHLLRRDIVDGDNEDGLVVLEEALQLLEVSDPDELVRWCSA